MPGGPELPDIKPHSVHISLLYGCSSPSCPFEARFVMTAAADYVWQDWWLTNLDNNAVPMSVYLVTETWREIVFFATLYAFVTVFSGKSLKSGKSVVKQRNEITDFRGKLKFSKLILQTGVACPLLFIYLLFTRRVDEKLIWGGRGTNSP